jgi:hypothetical protein
LARGRERATGLAVGSEHDLFLDIGRDSQTNHPTKGIPIRPRGTGKQLMNEWTDGSLINDDAIDSLTDAQLDEVLAILSKIK